MKKDKVIISLELPVDLRDKLYKESKNREMSMSALIRLIIKDYLNDKNDI